MNIGQLVYIFHGHKGLSSNIDMAPRSRKRAKKSTIASKNVVINALAAMPMDIIFEIFEYLEPLDLLRLARTTKALRAILMSRSSLSLWKRVRHAYYQMPDGPEEMSEPQYVSLALDKICDGCGHSFPITFWNAQLKSCFKCRTALLVNKLDWKKFESSKSLPSWLLVLLQKNNDNSLKQAQIWSQEYGSLSDSSAKLKWEWQCQIINKNALTKKHTESFNSWIHARDRERSVEHSRLIKAINNALLVKLEELGWGDEISKMPSYERDNLYYYNLSKNQKLGSFPQVWSSNGPAIVKALKAKQTARIEDERRKLLPSRCVDLQKKYDEYIRGLPADDVLIPNIADVAHSPQVYAKLTDHSTGFKVTQLIFPSIVSNWKILLDDKLIRMVQVKLSEPFTKDQLLLATTVFYCDACHMVLFYPQVLVHQCSLPNQTIVRPLQCHAWNSFGNIKFDRDAHQAAIDIINILGLDPKAVTAEDMAVRNSVLQCLDCRTTRQGRMTMIWSRAIEHSRKQHHRLPSMMAWKVPGHDEQLTLQAHLIQALAESDRLDSARPRFMCGVCRRKETLVGLNQHLLSTHEIQNPGEHDILFRPDVIQAPMPCVLPESTTAI